MFGVAIHKRTDAIEGEPVLGTVRHGPPPPVDLLLNRSKTIVIAVPEAEMHSNMFARLTGGVQPSCGSTGLCCILSVAFRLK